MEAQARQLLRIGELSKRSGVSPELLRAWERRYGLLRPTRSAGGLRLYSLDDLERVRLMRRHLGEGIAAAEAARLASGAALGTEQPVVALSPATVRAELADALDAFDEPRAQAVIDGLLSVATLDTVLGQVVLPYLHELGDRWERGEATVAQEHFASAVIRGRLLGLARGWGLGAGPVALLACLPGEQHDLGLVVFGLALRERGWRISYLGPDAPVDTVRQVARQIAPDYVVLNAVSAERVKPVLRQLRALAREHPVALGGGAVAHDGLKGDGIVMLRGDPIEEAERLTLLVAGPAVA